MQIWTVSYVQETDVMPFKYCYSSHDAAMQAVEDNAQDEYNAMNDPNSIANPPYEGLDWSDDKMCAFIDQDDSEAGYYIIQETELK